MGWIGIRVCRMTTAEKKEYLDRLYDGKTIELLKSRIIGSEYYCAFRVKETGAVVAGVALHHMKRGEWVYKEMTEEWGPCECKCPASILKLLTPTDDEYAKRWREKCWARIKQEKEDAKFAKEATDGYAVKIWDAAGFLPTYIQKLTPSNMKRSYRISDAIVGTMERAQKMVDEAKGERYEHCGFRSVSVVPVKKVNGRWTLS